MFNVLKPEFYEKNIFTIDFSKLKIRGIHGIIFDIDNTLMQWKSKRPDERVSRLLKELDQTGFQLGILSNSSHQRVTEFIGARNIKSFRYGRKPMTRGFLGLMKAMGTGRDETLIIGDQIFTDILGGNRAGIHTLLLDPIESREFITTQWIRRLEKPIRRRIGNKGEVSKFE